jgi:hypothetical protein
MSLSMTNFGMVTTSCRIAEKKESYHNKGIRGTWTRFASGSDSATIEGGANYCALFTEAKRLIPGG